MPVHTGIQRQKLGAKPSYPRTLLSFYSNSRPGRNEYLLNIIKDSFRVLIKKTLRRSVELPDEVLLQNNILLEILANYTNLFGTKRCREIHYDTTYKIIESTQVPETCSFFQKILIINQYKDLSKKEIYSYCIKLKNEK